ncbi:hypothetical protein [Sphingopyxis sp. BSNA05]|uniref:hypothetical protein n=1 Tax=Sphingopyxis sp. BSNA05 TaxID=1236614 RepID=UPI001C269D7E|nr:hypothetical protein [Sphingopyxis sp. BSNA05]
MLAAIGIVTDRSYEQLRKDNPAIVSENRMDSAAFAAPSGGPTMRDHPNIIKAVANTGALLLTLLLLACATATLISLKSRDSGSPAVIQKIVSTTTIIVSDLPAIR